MTANAANPNATVQDVDVSDPEFLKSPWPEMLRLQKEAPVYWSERQNAWIISGHADVRAGLMDRRMSAMRADMMFRGIPADSNVAPNLRKFWALNVNFLDGREHMRIRTLMMKAFDGASVRKIDGQIDEVVSNLLDRFKDGAEFEFMVDLAHQLPTIIMGKILGLPDEDLGALFALTLDLVGAISPLKVDLEALAKAERSINTMNERFNELIAIREKEPGDDLMSALIHARDGLSRLSHDELLGCLQTCIVAGAETTTHSLGVGLRAIASSPALQTRLRDDPDCAMAMVAELLRYPGTVKSRSRFAAEDFELHGCQIRKGDLIWLMLVGANVDERAFENPFEINVDRDNRGSMSFGPGLHFCVGHLLARTELAKFFKETFRRFDVEILQKDFEMVSSATFFGYRKMDVRFTPRV